MIKKIFKYLLIGVFGLFCLGAVLSIIDPDSKKNSEAKEVATNTEQDMILDSPKQKEKSEIAEDNSDASSSEKSSLTFTQKNAVRSARNYLSLSGFSRSGLIEQLSSDAGDGYSVNDATIAVDSLNVDWNENAARSAKQYLELSGFSCKGLIEQLSSSAGSKYTKSQATYGAHQVGACGEK